MQVVIEPLSFFEPDNKKRGLLNESLKKNITLPMVRYKHYTTDSISFIWFFSILSNKIKRKYHIIS